MAQRFEGDGWGMQGPEGWDMASEEGAVMYTSEDGGCLQMQGHRKKDGEVNDDDLDEVAADHLEAGAPVRDVRLGDFVGFEVDYDAGELSCREWFLRSGGVLLFGTLVRPVERRGVEDETVEQALISLRLVAEGKGGAVDEGKAAASGRSSSGGSSSGRSPSGRSPQGSGPRGGGPRARRR